MFFAFRISKSAKNRCFGHLRCAVVLSNSVIILYPRAARQRKAGRLGFPLGEPAVSVLHNGRGVYEAADLERREITNRRTLVPAGYNASAGGEYSGKRQDVMFNPDHLLRLARAAVAVLAMAGEGTAGQTAESLVAAGGKAVMERYVCAMAIVVALRRQGLAVSHIARKAGLGVGTVYGMLRDAGAK